MNTKRHTVKQTCFLDPCLKRSGRTTLGSVGSLLATFVEPELRSKILILIKNYLCVLFRLFIIRLITNLIFLVYMDNL